ncbi:secretin N-terminal domain-containing protein [Phycisphaerales bacterium AB-hyl4]|uniref:Secretin N-terminal domain-containing protein n=1 Tax=Natronomicrosphaera hydrolytica TaxID=3242702 RepID=A0ABV4U9C0_9BACT
MVIRYNKRLAGLFFCLTGIGYAGPVTLADEVEPASPAVEETANDREVVDAHGDPRDLPEGQTVEVGSFGQIDLHVKDLPLTQVLQLLSIQSQRNIVASRQVSGNISADLYNVDFYEALDAILHPNGYGYVEKGNFITVYTLDQIREMEDAERRRVSRIVRLNYITAGDVSAFVRPLLSRDGGEISVSGEVSGSMQPTSSDAGANRYAHSETIIIHDYPDNVKEIIQVIEELDVRPKQVLIEATILQATLSEANAFGVDFALFAELDSLDFSTPLGAVNEMIAGGSPGTGGAVSSTAGGTAGGASSIKLGYVGNDASVFVRALDSVTDTTVLATPKILALNRHGASLHVGEQLGYLSTTQTETAATQTVEFLDIGTQLNVRPFISEDNYVRLELNPQVSDGFTQVEAGTIVPTRTRQELTTNVIIQSGQTVVLGGLFKEDTTVDRRQVPGLGDIPIIGGAFRGQDDTVRRSEVIFLIKPTVIRDEALYVAGERASDTVETARVGVRRNLLPWSRTKLTSSHLSQAHEHLRQGDEEKALWNVNVALHLNPTSFDALQLKEEITGQRVAVPDRGVLRDAVDHMIDSQIDLEPEVGSTEPIEIGDEDSDTGRSSMPATEPDAEAGEGLDADADADADTYDEGDAYGEGGTYDAIETDDANAIDNDGDMNGDAGYGDDADAEADQEPMSYGSDDDAADEAMNESIAQMMEQIREEEDATNDSMEPVD